MNQNRPKSEQDNPIHQSESADVHKHVHQNEACQYSIDTYHDHDEHLEKTIASHDTKGYQRTLLISFLIITGYMLVEAIGGLLTGSLALLSDAGHMLSDAVALGATLMAFKIGEKAATHQKTFGYRRFEVLVASVNGATLVIIALMIFYEAIKRFNSPPEIATQGMLIVATIGMLINILVAWLMHRGSHSGDTHGHDHGATEGTATVKKSDNKEPVNLNMQSAY
ncbi:MAG TPA: cation diffusion facilitator family transporter, partial [Psychrobacter sp.]|uniref:cation diffusion facilitator family transporter n=1 Tax=Psychrobacter sp. TaxID=56811 RepID=UPI002CE4B09E